MSQMPTTTEGNLPPAVQAQPKPGPLRYIAAWTMVAFGAAFGALGMASVLPLMENQTLAYKIGVILGGVIIALFGFALMSPLLILPMVRRRGRYLLIAGFFVFFIGVVEIFAMSVQRIKLNAEKQANSANMANMTPIAAAAMPPSAPKALQDAAIFLDTELAAIASDVQNLSASARGLLVEKTMTSSGEIDRRIAVAGECLNIASDLLRRHEGLMARTLKLATELGATEAQRDELAKRLRTHGGLELIQIVRALDVEYFQIAIKKLTILREQWGMWQQDDDIIRFDNDEAIDPYNIYHQRINAIVQQQNDLLERYKKGGDPTGTRAGGKVR